MYSPKISECLIPKLYAVAKFRNVPMTVLVNEVLKDFLKKEEKQLKERNQFYLNK